MDKLKCDICGGDLIRDYTAGLCRCGHCGNSWPLNEKDARCADFSHITQKLAKAESLLSGGDISVKRAEEAILLYKSTAAACTSQNAADIAAEIRQLCKEGVEKAEVICSYLKAKEYMEKKAYDKALKIFDTIKDYRDSQHLASDCRAMLAAAKKRRIPYAAAIGMVLPAILFFYLKENHDISIVLCLLVFILASAALGYAVYLNGVLSVIVEVASFAMLVPLLIFTVLVYIFHIKTGLAVGIAIGLPLALTLIAVIISERQ